MTTAKWAVDIPFHGNNHAFLIVRNKALGGHTTLDCSAAALDYVREEPDSKI